MASVVVVGSFNVDHVWLCDTLPAPGATLQGRYHSGPGGKGFNQAIAATRAGAHTSFVCALGADAGGMLARELAKADGLALHGLDSQQPTGTAGIYVDARGRNSIVIGSGANGSLDVAFVEAQAAAISKAGALLAQLESPLESIAAALSLARASGVATLLNPAPANAATTAELLALADVITPNETEFATLLARHHGERLEPEQIATTDNSRLHALCREILPIGCVVITLGSTGVFVSHAEDTLRNDGKSHYRIAAEAVNAIDTTGAGDAFNGALAASLAASAERAFIEHVRFANRYAALSTERTGAALAMPRLDEVRERFAG